MTPVRELIREIHRRSLWQVTGIFLAASWGALQVIETITETAGLPDWTPSMALVLLLIGLPICLATAFVQEGMPGTRDQKESEGPDDSDENVATPAPTNLAAGTGSLDRPSTRPSKTHRLLTWKNAVLGGVGASALLGFSLAAYFFMWSSGIGPVGNLVAQGVIQDGERVILADFSDETGEGLGAVVTDALRVDLTQAAVLSLAESAALAPALARMQIEPGTPLTEEIATEVAVREGIGAVLSGGVSRVGSGYLVTASLSDPGTGRALATFRTAADGPADLIAAIDRLSQDVRERSGESLRQIKGGEPLERVTTSSLEALRYYSEAQRLFGTSQQARAIDLLQDAVEVDPEFAMAWRLLSSAYNNNLRFDLMVDAANEAFQNRDRLTEREQYLTEAAYYSIVLTDSPRSIGAYQAVLRIDPENAAALNNISNQYNGIGELEQANEMLRRAVAGPAPTSSAHSNLVLNELALGRYEAAADALRGYEEALPDSESLPTARFHVALMNGAPARAVAIAQERLDDPTLAPDQRADGAFWLGKVAYREGRLDDGLARTRQAARLSGQVAPPLATLHYMMGAYRESVVGRPDEAVVLIDEAMATGALSTLPIGFADFAIQNLALAGEVERAVAFHAEVEATRQEEIARTSLRAPVMIRMASGEREGLLAWIEEQRQEEGCLSTYCWEFERAVVAEAVGETTTAIEVYEQMAARGSTLWPLVGVSDLHGALRLGALHEEVGDTAKAIDAYQRVITAWENGDTEAQVRVRGLRARVAALGG